MSPPHGRGPSGRARRRRRSQTSVRRCRNRATPRDAGRILGSTTSRRARRGRRSVPRTAPRRGSARPRVPAPTPPADAGEPRARRCRGRNDARRIRVASSLSGPRRSRPIVTKPSTNRSRSRAIAESLRRRGSVAPQLFEIVIGADLGPEQMHDDIARVDQHPIAPRLTLDRRSAARTTAPASRCSVSAAQLPARTAGGDDHIIGDRRLAGEIDGDDVLGLAVIERLRTRSSSSRGEADGCARRAGAGSSG